MPGLSHPGREERSGGIRQSIMLSASLKSSVIFLFPDSRLRFLWEGCSRRPDRSDATPRAAPALWCHPVHPRAPLIPAPQAEHWGQISAENLLFSPVIAQGKVDTPCPWLPALPFQPCPPQELWHLRGPLELPAMAGDAVQVGTHFWENLE